MPIANCFVSGPVPAEIDGLTALWSEESGVGDEHMTVSVIASSGQAGARYDAMAFLYLPSLWSAEQVRRLQEGLARALARGLSIDLGGVHVITSIVESGRVVEDGETQEW